MFDSLIPQFSEIEFVKLISDSMLAIKIFDNVVALGEIEAKLVVSEGKELTLEMQEAGLHLIFLTHKNHDLHFQL